MSESQSLQRVITDTDRLRLALTLSQSTGMGEVPIRLADAAQAMGLSVADLAQLLNEPAFLKLVRGLTKAQASLTFHGPSMARLIQTAEQGSDQDALSAIKMLGRITGDLVAGHSVEVKVSFEELRKRAETAGDPLAGLFDIRESQAIDAEVEEVKRIEDSYD